MSGYRTWCRVKMFDFFTGSFNETTSFSYLIESILKFLHSLTTISYFLHLTDQRSRKNRSKSRGNNWESRRNKGESNWGRGFYRRGWEVWGKERKGRRRRCSWNRGEEPQEGKGKSSWRGGKREDRRGREEGRGGSREEGRWRYYHHWSCCSCSWCSIRSHHSVSSLERFPYGSTMIATHIEE